MPLVIPGIQSEGGKGVDEWTNKLMGKKLGDNHDEVVRSALHHHAAQAQNRESGC